MKTLKLIKTAACIACIAFASSAALNAQTLIDVNFLPTGGNGQAVLGGTTDTYNNIGSFSFQYFSPGSTLVANAVNSSGTNTGVAISTSTGFNEYSDNGNNGPINPGFLMDGYAFNVTNAASGFVVSPTTAFTLSGLTAYDGDTFKLVVYGSGNNSGEGDTFTLSGASTATGSTTGASRDISAGAGVAYQTLTGTITGDTLTITAGANDTYAGDNGGNTEVNGFQLDLVPAATPEPSTWAMMVGGLGLLVGIARFRSRAQV